MSERQYWVIVASRDHALHGVELGIVQANHGKAGPLRRMQPGDGLALYAPKQVYGQPAPCQCFVALGEVSEGPVYQEEVSADFQPFRRRAHYEPVTEAPIQPLLGQLEFSAGNPHWGMVLRRGCFAISAADFARIRAALRPAAGS